MSIANKAASQHPNGAGSECGEPEGDDTQSANAKAAACDDEAETTDEKEQRMKARKAKKTAEAQKAVGLPADGAELATMLAKSAAAAAEAATLATTKVFAQMLGVDVKKLEAQDNLAKAATAELSESDKIAAALEKGFGAIMGRLAAPAAGAQQSSRPALFVVGKDGKSEKFAGGVDVSKVEPVQGAQGDVATECATMIKAIHAGRPDVLNNQMRALGVAEAAAE